jgi:hypothetical protein
MIQRASQIVDRSRPYAIGAAWFFIAFSLAHLVWVLAVKAGGPAGITTLYQTDGPGGTVHRAWGLAYDGWPGLLLAAAQLVAVAGAALASALPWARGRRAGHAVLIAWSALWALDLLRLAMIDGRVDTWIQALLLSGFLGCTMVRAASPGRAPAAASPRPEPAAVDEAAASASVLIEPDAPATPPASRALRLWRRAAGGCRRVRDKALALREPLRVWAGRGRAGAAGALSAVASTSDRLARRLAGGGRA